MIKIRKAISLKYRCRNLSYLSTCNDSVKWFPFVMFSGPTSRVPLFGHHPFFSVAVPKFSQTELNWMLMTTKELQFLLCATGSVRLVGMNSFHGPFLIPTHTIATHTHCLRRLERKGATIRDYPVCPFSRNSMMMMCNIDQRDTLLPVAESSDNQALGDSRPNNNMNERIQINQDEDPNRPRVATNPATTSKRSPGFPYQLYAMLEEAERNGFSDIVSWLPCGKILKVHKPKEFEKLIMPKYFNQTRYKSFLKQLNIYKFHRFLRGEFKGCYAHQFFIRGRAELCKQVSRRRERTIQMIMFCEEQGGTVRLPQGGPQPVAAAAATVASSMPLDIQGAQMQMHTENVARAPTNDQSVARRDSASSSAVSPRLQFMMKLAEMTCKNTPKDIIDEIIITFLGGVNSRNLQECGAAP